jgi:hypothetical protein
VVDIICFGKESEAYFMTYKELAMLQEPFCTSNDDQESTPFKTFLDNQSSVIKAWFVLMLINLGLFIVLAQ